LLHQLRPCQRKRERECKEREDAKRERESKVERMTLADEHRAKREISACCGHDERERKRAKRERHVEKCCVFVMG
jgi:hypothetical protein